MPDGTKQIVSKEEGQGVMLSLFYCRELGYACPICDYCLSEVNKKYERQYHSNREAAKLKFNTVE